MFGVHIPDREIDRMIDRILTHERIERIARRLVELIVEKGLLPPEQKGL